MQRDPIERMPYGRGHWDSPFRLSVRALNLESGYFIFDAKTRGGGRLSGDACDLACALQHFVHGSPRDRLLKALRWMALQHLHRVERGAPDLVTGSRCFWDGSGFGKWMAAHG